MASTDFITWEVEKRSIKVYSGNKHVKSLPKIYEPIMDSTSLNFESKRLTTKEKESLNTTLFPILKEQFEDNLKKTEKYVFELIQKAEFLGVRIVKTFKKGQRLEAIYKQNSIERAIECSKDFYSICPTKLALKHCNY